MMPRPCLPLLLLPRSAPLQLKAAPWSRRGPPRSSPAWSRMRGGPRRPPRAGRPCAGASKAEEVEKKVEEASRATRKFASQQLSRLRLLLRNIKLALFRRSASRSRRFPFQNSPPWRKYLSCSICWRCRLCSSEGGEGGGGARRERELLLVAASIGADGSETLANRLCVLFSSSPLRRLARASLSSPISMHAHASPSPLCSVNHKKTK
jgi:hypothetical protein